MPINTNCLQGRRVATQICPTCAGEHVYVSNVWYYRAKEWSELPVDIRGYIRLIIYHHSCVINDVLSHKQCKSMEDGLRGIAEIPHPSQLHLILVMGQKQHSILGEDLYFIPNREDIRADRHSAYSLMRFNPAPAPKPLHHVHVAALQLIRVYTPHTLSNPSIY